MKIKCDACNGTGQYSGAPNEIRPTVVGSWNCQYCNGTGSHEKVTYSDKTVELSKPKQR